MAEDHGEQGNNDQDHIDIGSLEINGGNGGVQIDTIVQAWSQEYENLDHTLDEIDSWMDKLEQQNDNLFAELDVLLESSREARKELQEQNQQSSKQADLQSSDETETDKSEQISKLTGIDKEEIPKKVTETNEDETSDKSI